MPSVRRFLLGGGAPSVATGQAPGVLQAKGHRGNGLFTSGSAQQQLREQRCHQQFHHRRNCAKEQENPRAGLFKPTLQIFFHYYANHERTWSIGTRDYFGPCLHHPGASSFFLFFFVFGVLKTGVR